MQLLLVDVEHLLGLELVRLVQIFSPPCLHACRYTIFINIAVQGSSNKAWHIAQGPLSVVFGFGLGAIAAFCCSATRLWNNKYKRVIALVFSGGRPARVHTFAPAQVVTARGCSDVRPCAGRVMMGCERCLLTLQRSR
jgi:hypothetical protein